MTEEKILGRSILSSWLGLVCIMIVSMVIIGGMTRLTESGLSIVKWQPVSGILPPLNQEDWELTFKEYQSSPQYQLVNAGMSLDDFKVIFYWEYFHRLLGRLVGFVFLIPLVFFQIKGWLTSSVSRKLWYAFLLGAFQGFLGWYMVQSGLIDNPRVSHYRLAAHLGLACFLLGYLIWILLDIWPYHQKKGGSYAGRTDLYRLKWPAFLILFLITLQIFYGALVAGLRAGFGYNTFPMMGDEWIPAGFLEMQPMWINFFENHWSVQFLHRSIAWVLLFSSFWFWRYAWDFALSVRQKILVSSLMVVVILQFILGVTTLVHIVPISLASLHQAGALILFILMISICHSFCGFKVIEDYAYIRFPHLKKEKQKDHLQSKISNQEHGSLL